MRYWRFLNPRRFNPRSRRGERPASSPVTTNPPNVSIHAPGEGSDTGLPGVVIDQVDGFQSTLPARGATPVQCSTWRSINVSIHAPGEGSDDLFGNGLVTREVSIHAPGEGSDQKRLDLRPMVADVSIHAPGEGSDLYPGQTLQVEYHVSIHAPGEGSDLSTPRQNVPTGSFNPRSRRGERPRHLVCYVLKHTRCASCLCRGNQDYSS